MGNGPFQPGTWIPLPSNCTRSYTATYYRCATWGVHLIAKCVSWAATATDKCISWGWDPLKKCSWWSVFFCVLFAVVVTAVFLVYGIVVSIVCAAVAIVEIVVCLLWSLISIIFCLSKANGGTAFVLTAGTIMMQEFIGADLYYLGIPLVAWGTNRWWKLTPDQNGSYANGKWSRLADSNVAPTFFPSSVLGDGPGGGCGGGKSG